MIRRMNEVLQHTGPEMQPTTPLLKSGMAMFAELVTEISSSTKTNDKLDALINYFQRAPDKDKVWVIALFSGRRPKRAVNTTQLVTWCIEVLQIPGWLFGESYH